MKSWKQYGIWLCAILATAGIGKLSAATVNVFAAASLLDALKEIGSAYEKQSGDRIVYNFGASSTLARQIEEGAPADIFFSADEARMDGLAKKNLVINESRKSRLSNSLTAETQAVNQMICHSSAFIRLARCKTVPKA